MSTQDLAQSKSFVKMASYRSYEEKYPQLSDIEESRVETSDKDAPRASVEYRFNKIDKRQGAVAEL